MGFLGIDIGAVSAKAVVVDRGATLCHAVMDTGPNVRLIADKVLKIVLDKAGIALDDLEGIVATGYGRISVPFADKTVTEITCHARGVHHLLPEAKTIIDIGGQDSKAISVGETGNVTDFVMNDKCAAGSGRFLEVMARALELGLDEMASMGLVSDSPCRISSVCTVFAESEVVSLRAEGKATKDIVAGIHRSIARRVATMLSQIDHDGAMVLTGGVAKNRGVIEAMEDELKASVRIPENPQITGALGAALIASDGLRGAG